MGPNMFTSNIGLLSENIAFTKPFFVIHLGELAKLITVQIYTLLNCLWAALAIIITLVSKNTNRIEII